MPKSEFFFCYEELLNLWRARGKYDIQAAKLRLERRKELWARAQRQMI
jgi:hypothetical protein